jgi:hypothetical protein
VTIGNGEFGRATQRNGLDDFAGAGVNATHERRKSKQ